MPNAATVQVTERVRVIDPREARVARQAARHAFEGAFQDREGKPLPRADGDLWWPGTVPLEWHTEPVPAPLSRLATLRPAAT